MVEPIFEKLQPNEVLILFKVEDVIVYVANRDGEVVVGKAELPKE